MCMHVSCTDCVGLRITSSTMSDKHCSPYWIERVLDIRRFRQELFRVLPILPAWLMMGRRAKRASPPLQHGGLLDADTEKKPE